MNVHVHRSVPFALAAAALAAVGSTARADLGSYTAADGYNVFVPAGSVNWGDVSYYNAGQYGANAGGGPGPTLSTPNSGLWSIQSQAGGFFATSAQRNAATAGAPPYPGTLPPNTLPIYIVGGHFGGRTDNEALALRNDTTLGSVGAMVYDYQFDQYDSGGPNPASVTSGTVTFSTYYNPSPADNMPRHDKFTMGFVDSLGNVGVQWGYQRDNEVVWRTGSGPWNFTGIYGNFGTWDGIRMSIDLTTQTFQFDYYFQVTNTWQTIVPAGTPLGATMGNLTTLRWSLEDGVNNGIGGKNFFDDSALSVPAPGAALAVGLGALAGLRRRR